ncbi:hypothetical protein SAMN02745221_02049 [Thermosyntropha lipolytica DSM 11003]|uniref:Uncharacterized protein n=1 Tax=Thermosyntropha lipolytica DSM 11003 TaxID=1123382 RepID=A0A1M5RJ19_9FIRM|nr:hypothetical protein [Thermosyntropha lipolytica]SHH26352.1 hypothetical protein SAMN02745221_02049 [Thermosyntropha lipolytica DSM 11003]
MTCRKILKGFMEWWQGYLREDIWDREHYEEFVDWMYCHGIDVEQYMPYWK